METEKDSVKDDVTEKEDTENEKEETENETAEKEATETIPSGEPSDADSVPSSESAKPDTKVKTDVSDGDLPGTSEKDVSDGDVSEKDVSDGDVSGGDISPKELSKQVAKQVYQYLYVSGNDTSETTETAVSVPLWESDISDYSITDGLLLLILIVLIMQLTLKRW